MNLETLLSASNSRTLAVSEVIDFAGRAEFYLPTASSGSGGLEVRLVRSDSGKPVLAAYLNSIDIPDRSQYELVNWEGVLRIVADTPSIDAVVLNSRSGYYTISRSELGVRA